MNVTNGFGVPVDEDFLSNNIFDYLTLDEAAIQISPFWKRQHIHKELKKKRINLGELLIVTDPNIFDPNLASKGQKYFISKRETQRLKEEYESRPKRNVPRCVFCSRPESSCKRHPCEVKVQQSKGFQDTVQTVAIFLEKYHKRHVKNSERLAAFNRRKEERKLKNS